MTFLSPYLLLALVLVPAVLVFLVVMNRRRARYPVAFTNLELLATLVEPRRAWRRWVPIAFVLLALTCATAALARPRVHMTVPEENATIILLVDVSGSMRAGDVRPSRLDAAVSAMHSFVDKLPKSVKVGLVTFSSSPDVLTPPTTDRETIHNVLTYLTPEAATALSGGLETATHLALRTLAANGVHHEPGSFLPAAIVLESDGAQNRGNVTPLTAARHAKAAGIRVYGVALGTPHGFIEDDFALVRTKIPVPPDPETVRMIARVTGGKSYTVRTSDRLGEVYDTLGSSIGRKDQVREISSWFAGAGALLLVAGIGFSRFWSGRLP
jgi:Ca-activated chloride channel family protein